MSFRVKDKKGKQLLKNCNKIWEKIEKIMKIDFENKPVYGDHDGYKYIKTKIETYGGKTNCNFQGKGPYIQYVGGRTV